MTKRLILVASLAAGLALNFGGVATAQTYPTRPVKLIVPFPAGGPTDVMARMIAQRLSDKFGQMVIENRQGGGGITGAKAVATADPDGYTLLFGSTGALAISPGFYSNLGYDPLKAFAAVATVSEVPYVVVIHPSVPAKTVAELVAYAKANPTKLNSGATSATPPHLACEMFKLATGASIMHVPYKGGVQVVTDLLGGQVQMTCDQTTVLLGHIQEGKLRALATMSAKRLLQLPNVPTMVESGYPDVVVSAWFGVVAPAGTPAPIITRLNAEINDALRSPELQASFAKFGAKPLIGSPQEFNGFLAKEILRWDALAKSSGAKMD